MPTGLTFGNILNGLSLMNKDNANNAAAKDRQKSGDDAAMQRLLKSLSQSKELADAARQFEADQAYANRGQRTFERNEDWQRETARQMERDAIQRERDAAMRAQRMEELAKEQEFAAGAPDRQMKARLAEEEAENNRRLMRGMRSADAIGGDIGMAYEIADPNVGRARDAQALRSLYETNPAARFPGAVSSQIREGIDPVTGKRNSSALDRLLDRQSSTSGAQPTPGATTGKKPWFNLRDTADQNSQSLTNKIIKSVERLSRSGFPMTD